MAGELECRNLQLLVKMGSSTAPPPLVLETGRKVHGGRSDRMPSQGVLSRH